MKRVSIGLILAVVTFGAVPGASAATAETEHEKKATETFVDEFPCTGGDATITITYRGVAHRTTNKNVTQESFRATGTFVADPEGDTLPDYEGHFHQAEKNIVHGDRAVFTANFNVIARAEDGSRIVFHEVAHARTNKNGLRVEFDKPRCKTS